MYSNGISWWCASFNEHHTSFWIWSIGILFPSNERTSDSSNVCSGFLALRTVLYDYKWCRNEHGFKLLPLLFRNMERNSFWLSISYTSMVSSDRIICNKHSESSGESNNDTIVHDVRNSIERMFCYINSDSYYRIAGTCKCTY